MLISQMRSTAVLRTGCCPQHQRLAGRKMRAPVLAPLRPALLTAFPAAGSTSKGPLRGAAVVTEAKMKTRKAAAKRFRVTGTGRVKCRHPGKQHINEKKSSARLRKLGKPQLVKECDLNNVQPNLPYAGVK